MNSKLNTETSQLEILVPAKKENWQKAQKSAKLELIKKLSIKGFRKGKVPLEIGQKYLSQPEVTQNALKKMLDALAQEANKQVETEEATILSGPTYSINKISDVDLEVKFIYPVFPDFKITDYKHLDTKFTLKKVDEKAVGKRLETMRMNQTMLQDKDGPLEKGDVAVFDFEGFVDNKPFAGGKAEKHELEVGSNKFIPGFEDQMVGLQKNDQKDIEVTFPDDYHDQKLQGQKAVFKILIHKVKSKQVPDLNDDFAQGSGVPAVKNLVELKEHIHKNLTNEHEQEAQLRFQRAAFDEILQKTTGLIVPDILVYKEADSLKKNMLEDLKKQGIDLKTHLQTKKITEADLDSDLKQKAIGRLKDAFVFAEIAKLEKISVSETDFESHYQKVANIYSQSVDDIKKIFSKEQIQVMLMNKKVIDILVKHAQQPS